MICGQRYLPLHEFVSLLGDRCGKLLGIHLLTGSNTVNSFYVVRKPKAYKKLSHEILAAVGSSFNNLPSMNEVVANFYDLYGMERFLGTMNQLRYKLSAERSLCEDSLPPSNTTLLGHLRRAIYQAAIKRQADQVNMCIRSPLLHGWIECDRVVVPNYEMEASPDHEKLTIRCACRCTCANAKCSCRRHELVCADMCKCSDECLNREQ